MPFVSPVDPVAGVDASRWQPLTTVDLRQLPVTRRWKVEFRLLTTLGWVPESPVPPAGPDGTWPVQAVPFRVAAGMTTDLASVPSFLWGVIASYGRQTLPALVHDHLCAVAHAQPGPRRRRTRREADRLFRTMLAASGSGVLRRWLMWSAVRLFGLPAVAVPYAAVALALTLWVLTRVTWASTVALAASALAVLASLWAAVEEVPPADGAGSGVPAGVPPVARGGAPAPSDEPPVGRTHLRVRSVGSLLGAAAVATVPAVPIIVLGAATFLTEFVVGIGERSGPRAPGVVPEAVPPGAPAEAPVRAPAVTTQAPVARIHWQPLAPKEEQLPVARD